MSKSKGIRKKKYPGICIYCDANFVGTKRNMKYCSDRCGANAWYNNQSVEYKKTHTQLSAMAQKKKKHKYKRRAIDMLGGKCIKCGYNKCIAALDFHHVNPSNKDSTIKDLLHLSWKRIEKELKKCVILCANCHREEHFDGSEA